VGLAATGTTLEETFRERYPKLFQPYEGSDALPEHKPWDLEIKLKKDAKLRCLPVIRLSDAESEILKEFIDKQLKRGYYRPGKGEAGYPVFFVPKKDLPQMEAEESSTPHQNPESNLNP